METFKELSMEIHGFFLMVALAMIGCIGVYITLSIIYKVIKKLINGKR